MLNFYCCFIDCNGFVQCMTVVEGKIKGCIILCFEIIVKYVLTVDVRVHPITGEAMSTTVECYSAKGIIATTR